MKIYIVMGKCGEYSGREEWPVAAYFDEVKARNHVLKATEKANELYALAKDKNPNMSEYSFYHKIGKGSNEFDKNMCTDYYTGTSYFIYDVDVCDEVMVGCSGA